ncbi:AraC family transcriptional regulator [Psychroserpens ponticola]|uniref:Helix-turn-helix domain-containing protein n=1 Tax=Psychroserpens ponticola TaxID=2932268 RepID=A0ABY7RX51_9FLAO|nr:helix-turn-helix domain-containing protein [Psychroserpens ponticola]WCO00811.1 helix-turn-helix domain-containing protein [Psychroserpens ponticola]
MQFKKHKASKAFEHLIAYFWTVKSSEYDLDNPSYKFVPDAYVDWVFHLESPWQCDFPDVENQSKTGQFHVFGQIKKHINLTLPDGDLNVFAIKFHPWVAKQIWNVDMHHLTNGCLNLTDLDLPEMHVLQERIYLANTIEERIKIIETYLLPYANFSDTKSLKHTFSSLTVEANQLKTLNLGIGLRRLEQRFKNEIGISPKLFLRTCRINAVIEKMKENTNQSLTQLALEYNYFDQSHFIKDFKQFTGCNPSQFLKSINPDGDILNLRVKL